MKEGQRGGKDWLTIAKVGGGNTRWQGAVKGQETPKRGRRVRRNRNLALEHQHKCVARATLHHLHTQHGQEKGRKDKEKEKGDSGWLLKHN